MKNFINQLPKKTIYIFCVIIFLLVLLAISFFLYPKSNTRVPFLVISTPTPIILPSPTINQPLSVIQTNPANGEKNVSTSEQEFTVTTNKPILSAADYSLTINPPLPYYWKIVSVYPTNTLKMNVLGGLSPETTYALSMFNADKQLIYSWSFTTSNVSPQSSSGLVADQEKIYIQKYYPLFNYIPYSSSDFNLDYSGRLTLIVQIKNSNVALVQQEVNDWIRSHGVDPSTHTINYVKGY